MQPLRPAFRFAAIPWLALFLLGAMISFSDHAGHTNFHSHGVPVETAEVASHDHAHSHGHDHDHAPTPVDSGEDPGSAPLPSSVAHVDFQHVMMGVDFAVYAGEAQYQSHGYPALDTLGLVEGLSASIEYPPRTV